MSEIDKADRKILYELDVNSRLSYAQIGKRLEIAPETVRYRIQKLVEMGVVRRFNAVVNVCRLGYTIYKVFLKLQLIDDGAFKAIIDYLCEHPEVMWVARLEGAYDVGAMLRVKHIGDLEIFIDSLAGKFNSAITRRVFSVNIRGKYLPRAHLIGKRRPGETNHLSYSATAEPYALDGINRELLKQLASDSRTSAVDLAKTLEADERLVPISAEAVLQRIKRLEHENVITGYNILLDHRRIGEYRIKVLLYFSKMSEETAAAFLTYCTAQPSIVNVVKALGEWDYELDFQVREVREYIETLTNLTREFPGTIRDHVALMVLDYHKYTFFS